jgi:opacity protein-like surface antigen
MIRRAMTVIALLVVVGGMATTLPGQVRFGAQASFGDDTDFGIGARLEYVPRALFRNAPVLSAASFDWFFPDAPAGVDVQYWEINYNVYYLFTADALRPYAGGGLNIAHASGSVAGFGASDTQVGLNLGGGLRFRTAGRLTPFIEARVELSGGEQFVLTGGLVF